LTCDQCLLDALFFAKVLLGPPKCFPVDKTGIDKTTAKGVLGMIAPESHRHAFHEKDTTQGLFTGNLNPAGQASRRNLREKSHQKALRIRSSESTRLFGFTLTCMPTTQTVLLRAPRPS
jgi:hypothetical protein